MDVHSLKGFEDEEILRKLQQFPVDEFGITHINIMYNKEEEDKFFCLLDAPNIGTRKSPSQTCGQV